MEDVWDRDDPLEDVEGHELRGVVVHRVDGEIDERKLEPRREPAGDALARRDALVDDRLRNRAAQLGAAAHQRELVRRQEPRRREQVDDELRDRVHGQPTAERLSPAAP